MDRSKATYLYSLHLLHLSVCHLESGSGIGDRGRQKGTAPPAAGSKSKGQSMPWSHIVVGVARRAWSRKLFSFQPHWRTGQLGPSHRAVDPERPRRGSPENIGALRNQQPPRHSRESAAWRLKIKRILHVLGDGHPVSGKAGPPRSRRARCDRPADAAEHEAVEAC